MISVRNSSYYDSLKAPIESRLMRWVSLRRAASTVGAQDVDSGYNGSVRVLPRLCYVRARRGRARHGDGDDHKGRARLWMDARVSAQLTADC